MSGLPPPPPPSPHPAPQPGGGLLPLTLRAPSCILLLLPSLPSSHLTGPTPPRPSAPHPPRPLLPLLLHYPPPPADGAPRPPGPPSAPRDLQYSLSRSPLALRLRWLPPADSGGRSDVTYSLLCLRCGREGPGGACEPCGPRVAFVPRQAGLRERAATLLHLRPGARYTVRVAALNGVSGPAAAAGATYAQVTVSTGPGGKAARRVSPGGEPPLRPPPPANIPERGDPRRRPALPRGPEGGTEDAGDSVPRGQSGGGRLGGGSAGASGRPSSRPGREPQHHTLPGDRGGQPRNLLPALFKNFSQKSRIVPPPLLSQKEGFCRVSPSLHPCRIGHPLPWSWKRARRHSGVRL